MNQCNIDRRFEPTFGYACTRSWTVELVWVSLHRIRELPSSNLGPEAVCPTQYFLWFSSVPPGKCLDSVEN